jgi:hypothetical protein
MTNISVPTREEASTGNQAIFDGLEKGMGLVPNKTVTNYLHSTTIIPIDFPAAPPLA